MTTGDAQQPLRGQLRVRMAQLIESRIARVSFSPAANPIQCFCAGFDAFNYAVEYASIFRNISLALPFLEAAQKHCDYVIKGSHFPSQKEQGPAASVAYEQSVAEMCLFFSSELLSGRRTSESVCSLQRAFTSIDDALTEPLISEASDPHRCKSERDDWSRYVSRYLALRALCGFVGVTTAPNNTGRVMKSSPFPDYRMLIDALFAAASYSTPSEEIMATFGKAYQSYVSLKHVKLALVHGFVFSDAVVLSSVRTRGEIERGLVTMFDETGRTAT